MTAPISHARHDASGPSWRQVLRDAVRDLDELAALLDLPARRLRRLADASQEFPLLVPRGFVTRMTKGDLGDPLLLQVLPQRAERRATPRFSADPLNEAGNAAGGVLQKYAARALLISTAVCPVHCRYCFRREFPYQDHIASREGWQAALASLAARPGLREVILSGGDPLSLSNRRLGELLSGIAALSGVDTVRIHTRFPVMVPERIEPGLEALLTGSPLKLVVVIHCNHAQEIDRSVSDALARLKPCVQLLLNQSVLLRNVNDDETTLERLSRRLFECGVLPYYLHMLDTVSGTAHFEVEDERARRLVERLRVRLPGYLVPKLVREIPGELSKTPL